MKRGGWKVFTSGVLAVGLVVGGSLVAAPTAEANPGSILFPFITSEAGKFTFITIKNTDDNAPEAMHFTYLTKPVPVVNKAGCEEFDKDVPTTGQDVVIFEVNGKVKTGTGNALFEGPGVPQPLILPVAGRVGLLIVEGEPTGDLTATFGLFGYAIVIDGASGLFWAYSTAFYAVNSDSNPDFSEISTEDSNSKAEVTWYPSNIVTTSWYVLPLGTRSAMAAGIRRGLTAAEPAGAFDLDENFFSGAKTTLVRCLGFITRGDFLQGGVVASTDGGGAATVEGTSATTSTTDPVDPDKSYVPGTFLLFRIQSTSVLGPTFTTIHQEPERNPGFDPSPD